MCRNYGDSRDNSAEAKTAACSNRAEPSSEVAKQQSANGIARLTE
jgi:hypothetical protein